MSRFLCKMTILALVAVVFITGAIFTSNAFAAGKRVIVVFDSESSPAERRAIVLRSGSSIIRELSIVPSIVINLPDQASDKARDAILEHSPVVRIEDDLVVEAFPKPDKPGGDKKPPKEGDPQPSETFSWGMVEIGSIAAWTYSTGDAVDVAIVDTGIDTDHPDLIDNIGGGINIINPRKHFKDDNGHGTHVAGIVAAVKNEIGVAGVAKNAVLYGVKVLNKNGMGWLTDVAAGLEWCTTNGIEVVNMSLGTASYSQYFQDVVAAVYDAGIVQVAAAGNDGGPVSYPAAFPETIAVAATDINGYIPIWSNSGPEVDIAAPGVEVNSTYKGGEYRELSGTSMATPHVAGVVALILENKPAFTPDEVKDILTTTADDLGYIALEQGSGLVDADESALVTNL